MAELPDWAKDTPTTSTADVPDWAKDSTPVTKTDVDPIKLALKKSALAPLLISGVTELEKGIGAAIELVAPETGKKIYDVAQQGQKYVKDANPTMGTIGQVGSYVVPYTGVQKGVQGLRGLTGLATPTTRLGKAISRVGEASTTGGIVGGLTTPTEDNRPLGAVGGAVIAGGLQSIGEIGKEGFRLLNRAFGGDVKRLAEALRDLSAGKASKEAKIAEETLRKAKETSDIAEKTVGKQERLAEQRLRQEPGVTLQAEAGQFKPIGESKQTLGERIRGYTNQVFDQLKARRDTNAKVLKQDAFGEAYQKELAGGRITDTQSFKNLTQEIKTTLVNPVTGLSSESSQLQQLANKLQPTKEVGGVVVGKPISFQELDNIRRLLRDRSYGLPAEGYDAIGQIEAGNMAKAVEKVMKEFAPNTFEKYIAQYAKDSQPLKVFQTKVGKALVDEQLLGKGVNYAKVPAESIPNKTFANRDNFEALIDALGGNKQLAIAESKKFFASEMEGIKTVEQASKFIAKNRDMLKEVGMYDQINKFARDLAQAGKRADAARQVAKEQTSKAARTEPVVQSFRKHESDLITAKDASDVARKNKSFANDLLSEGRINQTEYRQLINASNEILTKVADTDAAKRQSLIFFGKVLGITFIGSLGYYGLKNIGD